MTRKAAPAGDSRHQQGGCVPGAPGVPAYTLTLPQDLPLPVLISVPHAGRTYPPALAEQMRHPAAASLRLEDRLVDQVAETVAGQTGAALMVARAPRAMIDLNRAADDVDWDMVRGGEPAGGVPRLSAGHRARSGLGLVPRRLAGLGDVWKQPIERADLEARLEQVHRPYHAALAAALERLRDRWGSALLVDLHSMPPLGVKHGREPAPDFVLGDRFGAACAPNLSAAAMAELCRTSVAAHNRPYAGGYVLDRHGQPARGIHAVQVEICRTTYLDSHLRDPGPGMARVVRIVSAMVFRLAAELGAGGGQLQAAE